MKKEEKFISDRSLTEDQFVRKYLNQFGNTSEIENYLRMRHRWMHSAVTAQEMQQAYEKTSLNEKANRL